MAKGAINWTRKADDGTRVEIEVRHLGGQWTFHSRERRPENWQAVPNPPLIDWMELLDAVERRIGRQLMKPEEATRLKKLILERYPNADLTA